VTNKAHIEGSIAEAYLVEEVSNFCSTYFETHVRINKTCPMRNEVIVNQVDEGALDIFKHKGQPMDRGKGSRYFTDSEQRTLEFYVLRNCAEVDEYFE
jgi:Domain of unknown function (DUF4218)